jgi:two-component system response regulator FixJ
MPESVVHVVDDDLAVRQSLSFLLASDGLAVRVHESAVAFLSTKVDLTSGCVLTDVRMPGIDGLEFLRRLKASGAAIPVIVMTGHADIGLAVEAMKQGAVDFVEKPFDDERLLAAIHAALERRATSRAAQDQAREIRARMEALSDREEQVLEGLLAGKPNKVIAADLGISPRTVEVYRANVMAKMRAGNLSELVRMALTARASDGSASS